MTDTLVGSGATADRAARPTKAASAFRTISEVADELDVAQHVLRFWESKFPQVHPLKRGGGRRYYRPEDIDLLRRIRSLLYDEGYTIKGVQKLLRVRRRPAAERPPLAELPVDVSAGPLPDTPTGPLFAPPADQPAPDLTDPERRRLIAELHLELKALARITEDLACQLNPSLSAR